ncbi:N-6 DNA methylase [Flavobacterium psychrophilum]|nr:N-6 DNA methylase [Flavobacterium psychrophilum]
MYDEAKGDDMELDFHWREDDNPIDFQVRLINLHKKGLEAFLAKEIAGIEDSDFEGYKNAEELLERKKKILMFNNVFAIKEVDDDETFNNNQRVLKEVVQLLEKYQIRYPRKQQHLSDFFELLLTTGLKQEVGQYFTPPPVTKFIVRSLPIKKMILQEINNQEPKLPAVIDYAAGSGHFITEALEEYQDIINKIDINKELTFPKAKTAVQSWVADPYNWAAKYVYGIEKDYRLVKVAKVGCYFYGDGVAQIIHGDGLDSFATSKTYKGLLQENINIEDSSKAKFSVVISNPPYAVNDCKDDLEYIGAQHEYTLYQSLSDKSKDIECLFVERTKHLLKDGGVASLILPSSILNNTGIQTKTREIILQYFDIVAIAELGSNTFMATGTNTVTLFLRRRANKLSAEWKKSVANFFENKTDITINGIEKPVAKYVNHVWENISFSDYISLLEKTPNEAIQNHEIYKEYRKKLKAKTEKDFWNLLLDREADKLLYFIIAYNQKVVLVKSGQKDIEKRFLGYEFSSRRNSEGMHAMQRGKTVDECTQMYDAKLFDNPEKASTYILKAFNNVDFDIDAKMQNHISRHDLVDMLTFDRVEFEKTISTSVKKK